MVLLALVLSLATAASAQSARDALARGQQVGRSSNRNSTSLGQPIEPTQRVDSRDMDRAAPAEASLATQDRTQLSGLSYDLDLFEELIVKPDGRFQPFDGGNKGDPQANYWYRGFADINTEIGGTYFRLTFASAIPCFPFATLGTKEIGYKFYAYEPANPKLPDLPVKGLFGPKYPKNQKFIEFPIGILDPPIKKRMIHEVLFTGLKPGTKYYGMVFQYTDPGYENLQPLVFEFHTLQRLPVVKFTKIHVIEDSDDFGEGEFRFTMMATYQFNGNKFEKRTPDLHKDMSSGESWSIGPSLDLFGAKSFKLYAAAHEEDGSILGGNDFHTLGDPAAKVFFETNVHHDVAVDRITVNVTDKWGITIDQNKKIKVYEGYKEYRKIKVDGRPHDVELAFDVDATIEVTYWPMYGGFWATNQDPWLKP